MLIVFVAFFFLKSLDLKHDSGSPGSPLPLIDQLPGWLPLSEPRYRLKPQSGEHELTVTRQGSGRREIAHGIKAKSPP